MSLPETPTQKLPPNNIQTSIAVQAAHNSPHSPIPFRFPHKNSLRAFLERKYSPSDAFVEGLLNRRDFVAFGGRRRHGKTTFLLDLSIALASGRADIIGYKIPAPRRVLGFFLEDDAAELQEKLREIVGENAVPEDFFVFTKDDFYEKNKTINADDTDFKAFIEGACKETKPDLIIFDNLAHLVRGDYNNSRRMDSLVLFVYRLQRLFNAAVVIAAHPRKRGNDEDSTVSLERNAEDFYEEIMGTSHFVNSAGTLWGIERMRSKEKTLFNGGTQRRDGSQSSTPLEMVDGWFVVTDDFQERLDAVLTTDKRGKAWDTLPPDRLFSRAEAESIVSSHLKHASFLAWWKELERIEAVIAKEGKWQKRAVIPTAHPENPF